MDKKARKLMIINRALHPRADVGRLYVSRREGGRKRVSIEKCIKIEDYSM